ncbi:helix-turn-helix domain-containing protein [Sphingobacterium tabacisoli]|uniref:Helix-turn-helix domain-containing protein n=1 Tax=Sphingobacterium tabacisoli TaxID=2044855 RepID=A0ABW5L6W9_9SPHI|nr:AraC family transcriptional regulator [Sphingobacterium tabacisoli]
MSYRIDASDFMQTMSQQKGLDMDIPLWTSTSNQSLHGRVAIYEESIKQDLHIYSAKYRFQDDLVLDCPEENPFLELHFNLSQSPLGYKNSFNPSPEVAPMTGDMIYVTPNDGRSEIYFKKDVEYLTFDIHIPLITLLAYRGENRSLDIFLDKIDQGRSAGLTNNSIKMNPKIWFASQEINNCRYEGLMRNIYMESKVLEILAFCFEEPKGFKDVKLSNRDIDCVRHAEKIISDHIDRPFTIEVLAKKVGINQTKLKIGFKNLFGTTVFGYLQELRMNRAKEYIHESELSIDEISQQCGYINVSSFSAAFKKYFGHSPSTLRR